MDLIALDGAGRAVVAGTASLGSSGQPVLRRYLTSMEYELGLVRCDPIFVRTILSFRLEDLVAIRFTPGEAFDQTPGPKAGSALRSSATA